MKGKNGDKLYQKYGKPLEKNHWGEYIAISKDGKTAVADDLIEVFKKSEKFKTQSHIFKIGERAVYRWKRVKK